MNIFVVYILLTIPFSAITKKEVSFEDCNNEFCQICGQSNIQCLTCRGSLHILDSMCYCPKHSLISTIDYHCIENDEALFKIIRVINVLCYFNMILFVLLISIGKTQDFTLFLEFAQSVVLIKYINFYFGMGFELFFNEFEPFFGKFFELSHENSLSEKSRFPPKLQIIPGFQFSLSNNLGEIIVILILAGFLLLCIKLLSLKFEFTEKGFLSIISHKIRWPFFARFLDFSALPIFFFSILEIFFSQLKSFNDYANFVIAVIMLTIYLCFLSFSLKVINGKTPNIPEFLRKYNVFIENLKFSETFGRNYVAFRITLKACLAVCMVIGMESFRGQIIGIMMILLVKMLFVFVSKPYVHFAENFFDCLNTFFLFSIHALLLYTSFDLGHLDGIRLVMLSMVMVLFLFSSLPFYFSLIQGYSKIKENMLNFPLTPGILAKRKHFFIDFEEKPSQNTKTNITKDQKQFDDFFKNPSPEISETSQEIARVQLTNYVQTDVKENERFENRDKKKKAISIATKSNTCRENPKTLTNGSNASSGTAISNLTYSQRIDFENEKPRVKKKGRTERSFKEYCEHKQT